MSFWQLASNNHNPLIAFTIVGLFIVIFLLFYSVVGAIAGLHNGWGTKDKYIYALNATIGFGICSLLMNFTRLIYGFFVSATMGFIVAFITVFVGIAINLICCTFCVSLGAFYVRSLQQNLPTEVTPTSDFTFKEKLKYRWETSTKSQKAFGITAILFVALILLGTLIATIICAALYANPSNVSMERYQLRNCAGRASNTNFKTGTCYPATGGESVKFFIEGGVHLNEYIDTKCDVLKASYPLEMGTCYNSGQSSFRVSVY